MPLALIVSPIRTWPADQGNRARILSLGQMLKERGYTVHFLLSELEGSPSTAERRAMEAQWDLLRTVPYRHQRRQTHADAWGGDDWYDPALDPVLRDLCAVWNYDLCLVNYAWYSAALEALPADVVRVIDTHDAYGDRHRRLYAANTTPVWYYTRAADEGRCLDRADVVLAIQDTEEVWFCGLTDRPVTTLGHIAPVAFLSPRIRSPRIPPPRIRSWSGDRLRAGYMASGNPSNQVSITTLIRHWAADPFLSAHADLHLAGPICGALAAAPSFVIRHGFVADPRCFYSLVDFAVNPNIGGSGLKIKSVESLSYGLPLFATVEGMLGICGENLPYVAPDVAGMTTAMSQVIAADPGLSAARAWARAVSLSYRARQIAAFDAVLTGARALRAARLSGGRAEDAA